MLFRSKMESTEWIDSWLRSFCGNSSGLLLALLLLVHFKSGKRNADKAFTGFLMKATKGQANPQVALKLLAQELAKLKEE